MKKWKKIFAAICTASMLVALAGMGVLADELKADLPADELEVDLPVDELEADFPANAILPADEETVGSGEITVGDGVTVTFDEVTGAVEFYSNGGTLWTDWVSKAGFDREKIKSMKRSSRVPRP